MNKNALRITAKTARQPKALASRPASGIASIEPIPAHSNNRPKSA